MWFKYHGSEVGVAACVVLFIFVVFGGITTAHFFSSKFYANQSEFYQTTFVRTGTHCLTADAVVVSKLTPSATRDAILALPPGYQVAPVPPTPIKDAFASFRSRYHVCHDLVVYSTRITIMSSWNKVVAAIKCVAHTTSRVLCCCKRSRGRDSSCNLAQRITGEIRVSDDDTHVEVQETAPKSQFDSFMFVDSLKNVKDSFSKAQLDRRLVAASGIVAQREASEMIQQLTGSSTASYKRQKSKPDQGEFRDHATAHLKNDASSGSTPQQATPAWLSLRNMRKEDYTPEYLKGRIGEA